MAFAPDFHSESMAFIREIYLAARLTQALCDDTAGKFVRKYTMRTLEMYYRSLKFFGGEQASATTKDTLVGVCFWLVYKFYSTTHAISMHDLCRDMARICCAQDAGDYERCFRSMEQDVMSKTKGELMPPAVRDDLDELNFHEVEDAGLPRKVVERAVLRVEECLRVYFAIKEGADSHRSTSFFYEMSWQVPNKMQSLHACMIRRCKVDSVFANVLMCICKEHCSEVHLPYLLERDLNPPDSLLPSPHASAKRKDVISKFHDAELMDKIDGINRDMVRELRHQLAKNLTSLLDNALDVEEKVRAEEDPDKPGFAEEVDAKLKHCSEMQVMGLGMIKGLQAIHYNSLATCRDLCGALQETVEETSALLAEKRSALKRKREGYPAGLAEGEAAAKTARAEAAAASATAAAPLASLSDTPVEDL